jgi:hypothetical protein
MKLIFVYNAEIGKLNTLSDIAHKIIKPETYQCSLCAITHDAIKEKKAWTEFKKNTNIELEFLHRDEFEKEYKQTYDYPVILENSDPIKTVISSSKLGEIKNVDELIKQIKELQT